MHCISCALLIKIYKIQPLGLLFLVVFINFYISRYYFSKDLITLRSFNIIWKKIFRHKFSFFRSLNSQNPLSLTKDFCHCCLFHMKITASVIKSLDQDRDPWHSPIFSLYIHSSLNWFQSDKQATHTAAHNIHHHFSLNLLSFGNYCFTQSMKYVVLRSM